MMHVTSNSIRLMSNRLKSRLFVHIRDTISDLDLLHWLLLSHSENIAIKEHYQGCGCLFRVYFQLQYTSTHLLSLAQRTLGQPNLCINQVQFRTVYNTSQVRYKYASYMYCAVVERLQAKKFRTCSIFNQQSMLVKMPYYKFAC